MKLSDKILIIADERVGTYSQSVALAKNSGLEFEIIFVEYGFFKFLPNFIFSASLIRLKKTSQAQIKKIDFIPKYIISAGRKSATIAIFLQRKLQKFNDNFPKIIQIMRPELNYDLFDYIIIPKHDKISPKLHQNVIISASALSNINIDKNSENYQFYHQKFQNLAKPITAILIGGDTKNTQILVKHIAEILNIVNNNITPQHSIIILNSRRTSQIINDYLTKITEKNIIFFDYNLCKNHNPYHNILELSDNFIITGDSISMISECCSTGKKVYIYDKDQISAKKHRLFHQFLKKNNYAKFLSKDFAQNPDFKPTILNESARIANLIFK